MGFQIMLIKVIGVYSYAKHRSLCSLAFTKGDYDQA